MTNYLTRDQVKARVLAEIKKAGSQEALAKQMNVTQAYISHVANGKPPGPGLCKLIGVERVQDLWVAVK